jgi:hypothetical protein
MNFPSTPSVLRSRNRPPARPTSVSAALADQLAALYELAQNSSHVFASPLGPVLDEGRESQLPRFVYFGPESSDASLRIAFYAGFDRRRLAPTVALLRFIEQLARRPALGEQLSLSFFPLIDVFGRSPAEAVGQRWATSQLPEIRALAVDADQRRYDAYVCVEPVAADDVLTVQLRTAGAAANPAPAVELMLDEDVRPFSVRWQVESTDAVGDGPLSLAGNAGPRAFEIALRLPESWSFEAQQEATALILSRFVCRYRALMAYGQNL